MPPTETPVLVIAFRRPALTERLLRHLVSCATGPIHVVVDGPRPGSGDAPLVERTREVVRSFGLPSGNVVLREANVGGPLGAPQAIDWFFSRNERGIVLDDDLLPHPSFFRFAGELLERYEDEPGIAAIHGWTCRLKPPRDSYYFSRYAPGWGWATWASRWKDFDREGRLWSEVDAEKVLAQVSQGDGRFVSYWLKVLSTVYVERKMNWDYRWVFTNFVRGRLTATAGVNLVDNLGWDSDALHTTAKPFFVIPAGEMRFPLRHPAQIVVDREADRREHEAAFLGRASSRLRYGIAAAARALRPVSS
jgi:hypothetical protein